MREPRVGRRRGLTAVLLAPPLLLLGILLWPAASRGQATFNYADALEKAIFFFDANKCGPAAGDDNVFPWRGACHTADGGAASPARDLTGGFHDAGDHVKFGLPQGFSASMLGWSLYEYRADFDRAGVTPKTLRTLKYFTDYFLRSHPNATTFYYQVGDGGADHGFWGSPENQTGSRPLFVTTPTQPAVDILGQHAGALALMSINYRSTDAAYADRCLTAARELFAMARTQVATCTGLACRGLDGGDFYNTSSHYDDLAWGAIWLSIATGDQSFLDPVDDWISRPNDPGDNPYQKRWTLAWDDMTLANLLKMFELTGLPKYSDGLRYNLVWYRDTLQKTPSGLPWLNEWGVLRYASAEAGLGYLAYKKFGYNDFFNTGNFIVNYTLGTNPRGGSFVTNYLANPPVHPHHRANEPVRGGVTHGMVGGLVGGPRSDDSWTDNIDDFRTNEVALDYNASYVFALVGRYYFASGGQPGTPPTPPPPPPMSPPGSGIGLTGTYFQGTALAGTPLMTRTDGTVNFNFGGGSPDPRVPNDQFSVRWEGLVEARSDEQYTFYVTHDDGARLFVNNQQIFNNFTDHAAIEDSGTIALGLGQRYAIRLEFYENGGDASCTLSWSTPRGITKQIIPQTQLYPAGPPSPDFSLSADPSSLMVNRGASVTSTVTIARSGGFTGAVALSASGLPSGVTATFAPASAGGTSSTLTLSASSTATAGPATVTVTGTSGTLVRTTMIGLTVVAPPPPDFSLSASPASLAVNRGASGASTINIARTGGFTDAVALTASGLPTGVTATFAPASTTGAASTLTLAASATATAGPATVTVTGTGGGLTHTTTVALTVNAPDFALSANPASLTINRGASGTSTVNIARTGGFTGAVALTASGLPTGVTATLAPASTTGNSSTLTLAASATATTGPATVTVTGTGGGLTHTTTIALTVNAPDFAISANPASLTVNRSASGTSTINVTRTGGFTGAVALSASGLPAGVTATLNPASATGNTSTLTLAASATATTGPATVTVTGTGSGLTHTTSLSLTVTDTGGGTGGVTATPAVTSSSPWFNEEQLRIDNTAPLTALSVTIVIQRTTGISSSGQYNTVGGQIQQSSSSTAATATYTFTLAAGQTLGTGLKTFAAQTSGTGTTHPTAGDTFTVTYTTGGQTFTQTGHF